MDIEIDEIGVKIKESKIKFCLVQYIWYHSRKQCGSTSNKKEKINVLKFPIITAESIFNECIRIPENIPTTMEYLDIIKVRYVFKIYVDSEKFKLPITIGDYYQ